MDNLNRNFKSSGKRAGKKISDDFLEQFFGAFILECQKYSRIENENSFAAREVELSSFICNALNSISNTYLTEYPVTRIYHKKNINNRDESKGRVDFWCRYKEKYQFLIEFKANYFSGYSQKVNNESIEQWKILNEQLSKIERDAANLKYKGQKGVIIIGIQLIYVYHKVSDANFDSAIERVISSNSMDKFIDLHYDSYSNFYKYQNIHSPNFSDYWRCSKDEVANYYAYNDTHNFIYPGLLMIGQAREMI